MKKNGIGAFWGAIFGRRWAGLGVATVLVLLVCWPLYRREAGRIEQTVGEREALRVGAMARKFAQDLQSAGATLRFFAGSETLREYFNDGQAVHLERFAREALSLSRQNPDFDQVRYIDEHGRERVRVDLASGIAALEALQSKADRAYFKEAVGLPPGTTYVSAFDLNLEHGGVEMPFKPTIRLAVPVQGAGGEARGIVVVNYLGAKLLDRLAQLNPLVSGRMRLLNAEGFWLRGEGTGDEWGFMLPKRAEHTLARRSPAQWAQICSNIGHRGE